MNPAIKTCLLKNRGLLQTKHILRMLNIKTLQIIPISSNQCRQYAKEVYNRDKPYCNVGTIGHVDHGKTTLTAAITKVLSEKNLAMLKKYEEIDCAPQEKFRGITINCSTIAYATEKRQYGHMDCPGHADYIRNMIMGTSHMDGAILVVAGTEGVMPQTKQHVLLSKQIGLTYMVVFINKADIAGKELIELVEIEVRDLLTQMGFDGNNTPVVSGSALCTLQGKNDELGKNSILKLLDAVDTYIPTPKRELDKPFLFPIEAVYSIKGRGTVISGRLEKGKIVKGQEVDIVGYNKKVKSVVTGLEMFYKTLEEARAGDKCGLLLRGVKREDIRRGMFVVQPNTVALCDHLEAQVYIMTAEESGRSKPLTPYMKLEVLSDCWECSCIIRLPGKEMVMPGEDSLFEMRLLRQMAVVEGQRFTLRNLKSTIGVGVVSRIKPNLTSEELQDLKLSREKRDKLKAKAESKKKSR